MLKQEYEWYEQLLRGNISLDSPEARCPRELCHVIRDLSNAVECAILSESGAIWQVEWSSSPEGRNGSVLGEMLAQTMELHKRLSESRLRSSGRGEFDFVDVGQGGQTSILFPICHLSRVYPLQHVVSPMLLVALHPAHITPFFWRTDKAKNLLSLLRSVARRWISWTNHHRLDVESIVARMRKAQTDLELAHFQRDLDTSLNSILKTATFAQLSACADSAADGDLSVRRARKSASSAYTDSRVHGVRMPYGATSGSATPDPLKDYLGRLASQVQACWHQRCGRGCPPCQGHDEQQAKVAGAAIRLSQWREVSTDDLDSFADARSDIRSDLDLLTKSFREMHVEKTPGRADHMILNRYSLRRFVLGEILSSPLLDRALPSVEDASSETVRTALVFGSTFVPHVVRCCKSFLGEIPEDSDVIESFTWLLGQYGQEHLDIEPRIDMHGHLLHLLRGEPVLHSLEPFYRGHFNHATEVYALGRILLGTARGKTGRSLCKTISNLKTGATEKGIFRKWYLVALLHDIGYAIKVLGAARDSLEFLRSSKAVDKLCKQTDDLFKVVPTNLLSDDSKTFFGFEKDQAAGKDHGVIGAHHLQGLIKDISLDRKTGLEKDYADVVEAIALHNDPRRQVSFRKQPLAFLLALADGLQEWNRPRLEYATAPSTMLSSLLGGSQLRLEGASWGVRNAWTNLQPAAAGRGLRIQRPSSGPATFALEYGEEINKNCGVFDVWLSMTESLQKLDFDGFPFNIRIEITTPLFERHSQEGLVSNLKRLQEAAIDTHMGFLRDWLPRAPEFRNDGGSVAYECNERTEKLILDARKVSQKRPFGATMSLFRKRLRSWRGYNEDRPFVGDYAGGKPE